MTVHKHLSKAHIDHIMSSIKYTTELCLWCNIQQGNISRHLTTCKAKKAANKKEQKEKEKREKEQQMKRQGLTLEDLEVEGIETLSIEDIKANQKRTNTNNLQKMGQDFLESLGE